MARLLINTTHLQSIFEPDGRGSYIPRDQSDVHTIVVTNAIGEGHRPLQFRVAVLVPKKICSESRDADHFAVGFLRAWLPTELATTNFWNFYYLRNVRYVGTERTEDAASMRQTEIEFSPTDSFARVVEEAVSHNAAVRHSYDSAKEKLSDFVFRNSPAGFQHTLGEAHQCFRTITGVLECSAVQGGYTSDDARHALRCYEDLARRKVANNHNYRVALAEVQKFVSGADCPEVWARKPSLHV